MSVSSKVSTSKDLSFNKTAVAVLTKESRCISKTATLALEPWSCTFDLTAEEKAVTCTPAILVLQKTPGKQSLLALAEKLHIQPAAALALACWPGSFLRGF